LSLPVYFLTLPVYSFFVHSHCVEATTDRLGPDTEKMVECVLLPANVLNDIYCH